MQGPAVAPIDWARLEKNLRAARSCDCRIVLGMGAGRCDRPGGCALDAARVLREVALALDLYLHVG